MAYKPPVAVYDACVLYPFHLRNLLIQCAVDRLVQARWTDEIHEEWIRSLAANTSGLTEERLRRTRDLMRSVLPDADVRGHHALTPQIALPDPRDRHVVAAAIAGGASIVVTWNLADFPPSILTKHHLTAQDPDVFMMGLHAAAPDVVVASAANARRNLRTSAPTQHEFLDVLERQGLRQFVAQLRPHASKL